MTTKDSTAKATTTDAPGRGPTTTTSHTKVDSSHKAQDSTTTTKDSTTKATTPTTAGATSDNAVTANTTNNLEIHSVIDLGRGRFCCHVVVNLIFGILIDLEPHAHKGNGLCLALGVEIIKYILIRY
jgi:hypothetical protein